MEKQQRHQLARFIFHILEVIVISNSGYLDINHFWFAYVSLFCCSLKLDHFVLWALRTFSGVQQIFGLQVPGKNYCKPWERSPSINHVHFNLPNKVALWLETADTTHSQMLYKSKCNWGPIFKVILECLKTCSIPIFMDI